MSGTQAQFTQALWTLSRGEALTLDIGPGPRELSVAEGRVWLTESDSLLDVWLEPGQSVQLASGSKVVLEAWPTAQFQLLVPPAACPALARRAKPAATTTSASVWAAKPSSSGLAAA